MSFRINFKAAAFAVLSLYQEIKQGEFVIKPQFEFADDFSDGFALIKFNGKFGFISRR
jgi:hypothetical protein